MRSVICKGPGRDEWLKNSGIAPPVGLVGLYSRGALRSREPLNSPWPLHDLPKDFRPAKRQSQREAKTKNQKKKQKRQHFPCFTYGFSTFSLAGGIPPPPPPPRGGGGGGRWRAAGWCGAREARKNPVRAREVATVLKKFKDSAPRHPLATSRSPQGFSTCEASISKGSENKKSKK